MRVFDRNKARKRLTKLQNNLLAPITAVIIAYHAALNRWQDRIQARAQSMGFISHAYVCPRIAGGFGIFGFSIIVEVALVGYLGVGYSGFVLEGF